MGGVGGGKKEELDLGENFPCLFPPSHHHSYYISGWQPMAHGLYAACLVILFSPQSWHVSGGGSGDGSWVASSLVTIQQYQESVTISSRSSSGLLQNMSC